MTLMFFDLAELKELLQTHRIFLLMHHISILRNSISILNTNATHVVAFSTSLNLIIGRRCVGWSDDLFPTSIE